jgi:hypothetical protein
MRTATGAAIRGQPRIMRRLRFVYAALGGTVIIVGLILHSQMIPLPPALRKYVGDALWAAVVFFGFGFILNRAATGTVAISAFCFAALIETSQLYHAPWIDSIRATRLAVLILGTTFNWPDFIAYAIGIGFGVLVEIAVATKGQSRCS